MGHWSWGGGWGDGREWRGERRAQAPASPGRWPGPQGQEDAPRSDPKTAPLGLQACTALPSAHTGRRIGPLSPPPCRYPSPTSHSPQEVTSAQRGGPFVRSRRGSQSVSTLLLPLRHPVPPARGPSGVETWSPSHPTPPHRGLTSGSEVCPVPTELRLEEARPSEGLSKHWLSKRMSRDGEGRMQD